MLDNPYSALLLIGGLGMLIGLLRGRYDRAP